MQYVKYNRITGDIISTGNIRGDLLPNLDTVDWTAMPGGADPKTQYIDVTGPSVADKVDMPLLVSTSIITADGVDSTTISNIAVGALVFSPAIGVVTINDGELIFTTDLVGSYLFTFRKSEYLQKEITIDAV